jgi:hypothetical protein
LGRLDASSMQAIENALAIVLGIEREEAVSD